MRKPDENSGHGVHRFRKANITRNYLFSVNHALTLLGKIIGGTLDKSWVGDCTVASQDSNLPSGSIPTELAIKWLTTGSCRSRHIWWQFIVAYIRIGHR